MKYAVFFIVFLVLIISKNYICFPFTHNDIDENLSKIELPAGFKISIYAKDVYGARSLVRGTKGTIFVGSRSAGNVYALVDSNNDYKNDKVIKIASNLNSPNGVAFYKGSLYVAEINRILRYDNIEKNLNNPPKPVIVNDSFPDIGHHGWKYIAFGPDNKLYVPVGAPCNICLSKDKRFSSIMRMNANGSSLEIFAHGVRNTVGFDWNPKDNKLWFTDNGRDWMGDNLPPDELNFAPKKGLHFGYPFWHGKKVRDPKYGKNIDSTKFVKPVTNLGPHVAALGMKFYRGKQFPKKYHNNIFIAEHGSWNRSTPIGYRVTLVKIKDNKHVSYTTFAKGWLKGIRAWGRPVDILELPDGSLLVSDDRADAVYRIRYE